MKNLCIEESGGCAEINRGQFLRLGRRRCRGDRRRGAARRARGGGAARARRPRATTSASCRSAPSPSSTSLAWYRGALRVPRLQRRRAPAPDGRRDAPSATTSRGSTPPSAPTRSSRATSPRTSRRRVRLARPRARRSAARSRTLLVGVYLNGAAFARDSATRLLLGRLLDLRRPAARVDARPERRGPPARASPSPLSLEQAGARLDRARHHPELPQLVKGPAPVLTHPDRARRMRARAARRVVVRRAAPPRRRSPSTAPRRCAPRSRQIDSSPTYNFAGSNQLQLQIERGAPADLFASASPAEPQALFREGRCTRPVTFATNILVDASRRRNNPAGLRSVYGLRTGGHRLAVGTAGVPIGAYTRQLLRAHAADVDPHARTRSASSRTSTASSRRSALGSADAGFAYFTDCAGGRGPRLSRSACRRGRSRRSATRCASCARRAPTPRGANALHAAGPVARAAARS